MTEYRIELTDPVDDSDDVLAERCAFNNAITAEAWPDIRPVPLAQFVANHRAAPERLRRHSARARTETGELVGVAAFAIDPEFDFTPDLAGIGVNVLPEHRRQGVGTRLLAALIEPLRSSGKTRVIADTIERVPAGEAFARAVGAEGKQEAAVNQLVLAGVDRALLERWVADGPVRAPDYELVAWDGACPEENLVAFAELIGVMNDAPHGDIERNDFVATPEMVRDRERQMAAAGIEAWTIVARRVSDGALAGLHDVYWNPHQPEHMEVGATGVKAAHRGHALGKWLKATMTLRVLDERPEVTSIRTGNADSNEAMLSINRQMGYEREAAQTVWELPLDRAEAWLETKLG